MLLAGCAGAGSAHDGAEDNRRTVAADLGTTFKVSVRDSVREKPAFSPALLSRGDTGVDEGTRQQTLECAARALAETEIRIGRDFSLQIRVASASDRPDLPINNQAGCRLLDQRVSGNHTTLSRSRRSGMGRSPHFPQLTLRSLRPHLK